LSYCYHHQLNGQIFVLGYTCQMFVWSMWSRFHELFTWPFAACSGTTDTQVTCLLVTYKPIVGTQQQDSTWYANNKWEFFLLVSHLLTVVKQTSCQYVHKSSVPTTWQACTSTLCLNIPVPSYGLRIRVPHHHHHLCYFTVHKVQQVLNQKCPRTFEPTALHVTQYEGWLAHRLRLHDGH
jgi:hypothetical protein